MTTLVYQMLTIQLLEKFVTKASRRSHSRATAHRRKLRVSQIHSKETIWATSSAHMEGLVRVSDVSADNDLRRLRFLYDRVEAHVRALQTLAINSESLLMPLLMEKLPPNVRFIISRAVDQPE